MTMFDAIGVFVATHPALWVVLLVLLAAAGAVVIRRAK